MKKLLFFAIFIFSLTISVFGQETQPAPQPTPTVQTQTVSQDFVDDATKAFSEVVALRDEVKVLKEKTVKDLEKEIVRLQIELARNTGELIGVKQQIVECRADKQFLLTNGRIKKYGFIVF